MTHYRRGSLVLLTLAVFGAGVWIGSLRQPAVPPGSQWHGSAVSVPLKPGPWGEMDYTPMSISAPEESLPVRSMEGSKLQWFFSGYSRDDFERFLDTLQLNAAERTALLTDAALCVTSRGSMLTPPDEVFFGLSAEDRLKIFQRLALYRENDTQLTYISTASLEERFRSHGVLPQTAALFQRLSCPSGGYRIFSGFGPMLSSLSSYDEKVHLLKALTRQKTLLLRLHLTRGSDVNSLANYWGKACWNTDVKAMLSSVGDVPGGTWLDIIELLPPLPTSLLYTFPLADNPTNGPARRRDCHWTSFNFFRDPPDYQFSEPQYFAERLRLDYYPISGDPRYGDLILFTKADGTAIHSAIYLADEVVYTKNGDTPIHPWMLSTMKELLEQYSFLVPAGERLNVTYFRNKYY